MLTNDSDLAQDRKFIQIIMDSVYSRQRVKLKWKHSLLNIAVRFFRKHKGHGSVQKYVDFQSKQLDIRSLISNSIGLRDFFRCFLNHP